VPLGLASLIKPGVILWVFGQACPHRIVPDIVPFLQKFFLIPHNAVIALILPDRALAAPVLIDSVGAESFHTVYHLGQIENAALGVGKGLGKKVDMVRHNDCHIHPPFKPIPIDNGIHGYGAFFGGKMLAIPAAPG
jgi:hypothetical protein